MLAQALYCCRGPQHKTPALFMYRTEFHVLNVHVNVQNNLVFNQTVQLALGTALMIEYLSNNIIGLVLVSLPRGSTNATASPSQYMTHPSGIPTLSSVLFMDVGNPNSKNFWIYLSHLLFSLIQRGT